MRDKITCHYFNEENGSFLFTRERIPEEGDYCDSCGQTLSEEGLCSMGTGHYWVEYVADRYIGR